MTRVSRWILSVVVIGIFAIVPLWRWIQWKDPARLIRLGLDLAGGTYFLVEVKPFEEGKPLTQQDIASVGSILQNRLDPTGNKETLVLQRGADRFEIQIPGEKDPKRVRNIIEKTAFLEFLFAGDTPLEKGENVEGKDLPQWLKGEDLKNAYPTVGNLGQPVVGFDLKSEAGRKFARLTEENIQKFLCIVLDKIVISCPTIRDAITGGSGIIEGQFTVEDVQDMVAVLNSGKLPARVEVVNEMMVSPYLGKSSIESSMKALLIGGVLILLFMLVYYRALGLVADIALLYYAFLTLGVLISLDAALTIYGVAGLVLSVGMAVDANVLIFSRIWDEYKRGKTMLQAVEDGHKNAMPAIIDSNVTTLIAAAVLYLFGSGTLKGFATTLSIGILVSMFSALYFSRMLLEAMVRLTRHPAYFGIRWKEAG